MFENTDQLSNSVSRALAMRGNMIAIYHQAKALQKALTDYLGVVDPNFNAAMDAIYSPEERAEFGATIAHCVDLITELETNHPDILRMETTA